MSQLRRMAHIVDGVVANVSVWDGATAWDPGCEVVELPDDSPVSAGWVRVDGELVAPILEGNA